MNGGQWVVGGDGFTANRAPRTAPRSGLCLHASPPYFDGSLLPHAAEDVA